jgi:hypothetical protein
VLNRIYNTLSSLIYFSFSADGRKGEREKEGVRTLLVIEIQNAEKKQYSGTPMNVHRFLKANSNHRCRVLI